MRLRPKKFESHPVNGKMMALATRYEVRVQVNVRKRYVHYCRVQHLHKRAEHDRNGYDPGVNERMGLRGFLRHQDHEPLVQNAQPCFDEIVRPDQRGSKASRLTHEG
jgi:hypothetical protein